MILNNANMSYFLASPGKFSKRTRYYDSDFTHEKPEVWMHEVTPQVSALVSSHVRTGL